MSRNHARIVTTIWIDQDWRKLNAAAQWLYMTILTQPDLSYAGTLSVNTGKWSKMAQGMPQDIIAARLSELADARFLVLDEDSDELMVRSFIRNDGVAKQPKILMSACRSARTVVSELIRSELAYELTRIGRPNYDHAAKLLEETVAELAPDGAPSESPSKAWKGYTNDQERVYQSSPNPNIGFQQNPRWKGNTNLPERAGGGGGGYCSSNSKGSSTPPQELKDDKIAFEAFCEAYPKPVPKSQRIELLARWKHAASEHGTDRLLTATRRYAATFESHETQFSKNPTNWIKDDLFVEHLPDELEPSAGMDVVAWLDRVTELRDIGTATRYGTGDTFQPQWPAEYEQWTKQEADAFREIDKDRWFAEHREMHLEVLSRRYGDRNAA